MILGTNKKLCGIIDHSGNKDKGHYQYLYLSGDDWVCFNDAKIALLTEESI
jgi:ubiquitin C-terminal hydrolase